MSSKQQLLKMPISSIQASEEFIEMCILNDFNTLEDIVAFHIKDLQLKPGFDHRMLKELYKILESHNVVDQLKEL